MIPSSREADYRPKQEDKTSEGKNFTPLSGSTSWSRLKDPRIVRVSRAFGGKDRHSKVWTVKGLRDRRVRLSVTTAIQLYDLQNRLGLNQPSKVVDWLLKAAKHEIDELPPLQMPSGNLSQYHQAMMRASHEVNEFQSVVKSEGQVNWNDHSELSTYWSNSDANLRDHMKSKEIVGGTESKSKERLTNRKQHSGLHQGHNDAYTSTSNFFGRANQSNSQAGLLNNTIHIPNPSFLGWDRSNLTISYAEDHPHRQNFNVAPIVPSTSLSTPNGSQFVVYPPAGEFDPKQVINIQMLSSNSTSPNSTFSNPPINYSTSLHYKRSYHETIPFEHESL